MSIFQLTLAELKKKIESGESNITESKEVAMQKLADYESDEVAQLFKYVLVTATIS